MPRHHHHQFSGIEAGRPSSVSGVRPCSTMKSHGAVLAMGYPTSKIGEQVKVIDAVRASLVHPLLPAAVLREREHPTWRTHACLRIADHHTRIERRHHPRGRPRLGHEFQPAADRQVDARALSVPIAATRQHPAFTINRTLSRPASDIFPEHGLILFSLQLYAQFKAASTHFTSIINPGLISSPCAKLGVLSTHIAFIKRPVTRS